jgi:hypothetical protein
MFKYIFALFVFLHGCIHFMGFAKAFNYGNITQLTKSISRQAGVLWLLAAILFIAAAVLYLLKKESWPILALIAAVLSQLLIAGSWKDAKFGTLANLLVLLVAIPGYAGIRFRNMVKREVVTLMTRPVAAQTVIVKNMLDTLPPVVQKWLLRSGVAGKDNIQFVRLKQKGEMRLKPGGKWMPFTAVQYFDVNHPSFNWQTQVNMMPLITLNGRDRFDNGTGSLLIKILGLFTVARAEDGEKVNSSTMIRYLAETCWFPTAALRAYIRWEAMDSASAKATMSYKGLTVSGIFRFNEAGDMTTFTAMRYYGTGEKAALEKWVVQTEDWKLFGGMRIPYKSKVSWQLAAGEFNWVNMELTDLEFNKRELYE